MRVVILNNDFRVYWKGRLVYLRGYLATQGIELNALELFGKGSPYAFDTVNSAHNWWGCLYPDKSAVDIQKQELKKDLFAQLDKLVPDVIIGPSIVFFAGALGIAWAKKNKKKFIMFDDARPAQVKRNAVVQWVKNLITISADALWLPTKSYDTDYAMFRAQGVHFFYGFACIDNDLFKTDREAHIVDKIIVCVARLVPIKNLHGLLQAWYDIEQQDTGYRLMIIGNGPEEELLKDDVQRMGLTSVLFIDAVSNDELPAYFGGAEAFILPSFSETWGLVVNEAMASGLPVLLSRTVNAANDLLVEGVNGFGFDAFNTQDIAKAILRYTELPGEEKRLMSEKSLEMIDNMSYQKMGFQLKDALQHVAVKPYRKPDLVAAVIIGRWHGRYNTAGWDKL
ncbi:glycosyltransferase [Mucilaginibacter psychrotolerans]|uniref:Glycosyltransferase n=1 Tax=Mucilaginibacter psychrotolerans TaxID=1524096 RepID=A0A4Y8SJF9_9SPHI|nr:glycosyltransferase [Mucilaginibacter psychrotolerans]TFF38800.1 glycosyltransferase [Mucilaginibacter psychrotolerans]